MEVSITPVIHPVSKRELTMIHSETKPSASRTKIRSPRLSEGRAVTASIELIRPRAGWRTVRNRPTTAGRAQQVRGVARQVEPAVRRVEVEHQRVGPLERVLA